MYSLKFYSTNGQIINDPTVAAQYRAAHAVGNVRIGEGYLFIRSGLRTFALKRGEIRRCYRRVMRVPMKMCCGSGNLDVEHLVVEGEAGELAQVQLPGTRAAVALMDELKRSMPEIEYGLPGKAEAKA